VVLFSLKNTRATYQNKVFDPLIGKNIEVYVDNMIVKSKVDDRHTADLRETFTFLQRYSIKLNPEKCAFAVRSRMFLGFMVSSQGIETNLDKVQVVLDTKPPWTIKRVQWLTDYVAKLGRFM